MTYDDLKSKASPGPWRVCSTDESLVIDSNGLDVAASTGHEDEERRAVDAALIAHWSRTYDQMREALNKIADDDNDGLHCARIASESLAAADNVEESK